MPSFDYDLRYLQAGLASLEAYLLSKELYWTLHLTVPVGNPPYPPLTLDSLLLARVRVSGYSLPVIQEGRFSSLCTQMDAIHSRWRVAWEQKAGRSFRSRLNLWRDFLEEYGANPGEHADRYRYESRLRVMLHLLEEDAHPLAAAELDLLAHLDSVLKPCLVPGPFLWDAEQQKSFPAETYWYLYGSLP